MTEPKVIAVRRYGDLVIVFLATDEGRISFHCLLNHRPGIITMPNAKVSLGQLVATPGALEALQESGQSPQDFVARHVSGDWGTVCPEDWELNNQALIEESRIISAYVTLKGKKIWIITEHDRSVTTILLPDEY